MDNKTLIDLLHVDKYYNDFPALKDISFHIGEGERVGIIGENGAGKTTLLSLIAGMASATSGKVAVQGKVNAIMDLGVGIREELTGYENIYISGGLNGKTRAQIEEVINEIVDFADIGDYIYNPVKTYSSGMKARLAFAMLAFVNPEILIIDEVLGVGDAFFVDKSTRRLRELCARGKILLVVSHSMDSIKQLTERCLWLSKGQLLMDGDSATVCQSYKDSIREREEEKLRIRFAERIKTRQNEGLLKISDFRLLDASGQTRSILESRESVSLSIVVSARASVPAWDMEVCFYKMDGTLLQKNSASQNGIKLTPLDEGDRLQIHIDMGQLLFSEDFYELSIDILSDQGDKLASEAKIIKIENSTDTYLSKPDYFCDYKIWG